MKNRDTNSTTSTLTTSRRTDFSCSNCGNDARNMILTDCQYTLCYPCFNQSPFGCIMCNTSYTESYMIDKLTQSSSYSTQFRCRVCQKNLNTNLKARYCKCDVRGQPICIPCQKKNLKEQIEKDKVEFLQCSYCFEVIGSELTQKCSTYQNWLKFEIRSQRLVNCPGCNGYVLTTCTPQDYIRCLGCSTDFCKECIKTSCVCRNNTNFTNLQTNSSQIMCPYCRTINTKGNKNHCQCSNCSHYFCAECYVPYMPNWCHGKQHSNTNGETCGGYHRPCCRYYSDCKFQHGYSNDCYGCLRNQQLCTKPSNLRNGKRTSKDEQYYVMSNKSKEEEFEKYYCNRQSNTS